MNTLINSLNLQLSDLYSKQCIELVNIFNKFLDIINTCFKYIIINNQNIKHLKKLYPSLLAHDTPDFINNKINNFLENSSSYNRNHINPNFFDQIILKYSDNIKALHIHITTLLSHIIDSFNNINSNSQFNFNFNFNIDSFSNHIQSLFDSKNITLTSHDNIFFYNLQKLSLFDQFNNYIFNIKLTEHYIYNYIFKAHIVIHSINKCIYNIFSYKKYINSTILQLKAINNDAINYINLHKLSIYPLIDNNFTKSSWISSNYDIIRLLKHELTLLNNDIKQFSVFVRA